MEIKQTLLPPMMPNFVGIKMAPTTRQEGFQESPKIPITDFTEEEAIEFGELMKKTFIEHWKNKKAKI